MGERIAGGTEVVKRSELRHKQHRVSHLIRGTSDRESGSEERSWRSYCRDRKAVWGDGLERETALGVRQLWGDTNDGNWGSRGDTGMGEGKRGSQQCLEMGAIRKIGEKERLKVR